MLAFNEARRGGFYMICESWQVSTSMLQKTVSIEENRGKYEVGSAGDRPHGEDGEGSN